VERYRLPEEYRYFGELHIMWGPHITCLVHISWLIDITRGARGHLVYCIDIYRWESQITLGIKITWVHRLSGEYRLFGRPQITWKQVTDYLEVTDYLGVQRLPWGSEITVGL